MLLHNPAKLPSIDWFEEVSKDATTILHARHFLCLDNLKVSSNPGFAGYAPWHSESFPGQPCACGGGLGWGQVTDDASRRQVTARGITNIRACCVPPPPLAGEGRDHADAVVTPPSTTMVWPVMKL